MTSKSSPNNSFILAEQFWCILSSTSFHINMVQAEREISEVINCNKRPKIDESNIIESRLRKLGFCGADDSVSPNFLGLICQSYPFVEFGVLFRPDKVSCN